VNLAQYVIIELLTDSADK